ncbi:MAG TPA: LCP family protein, partial [Thermoleophilaceae bacterium]
RKRLSRNRDGDEPRAPRDRPPITPGRVLKWVALAIAGWLLLSLLLFLISAQTQEGVSAETERALSSEGSLFTGSNILVLGSDVRTGESIDESQSGPGRSDTIMLVHAAFGSVRKLSIPRDVEVEVPGHGINKINAAYALGGPALTIETVESFLGNGLKVNHVVEVDFKNFPDFIDSLGGITVTNKTRICSPPFDNFWKGLHFKKGEIDLNGTRALGYARVRKNSCAPAEDDRDRAARQQQVLSAIGSQVKSPSTFVRLPWVSWNAPRTLRSDMNGLQLMGLFADMATGTSDRTEVLEATCCRGSNLFVSDGAKADAVRKLVEGD